jgi:DNA-binding CsgD family transcriptional regulator
MVAGGRWAELHELVPARLRDTDTEELTRHTVALKAQLLMVCAYQGRREQADPLLREVRQWARVHGSVHYLRLAGYAAHLLVSAYDGGAQASADHVPLWADDDPAGNVVTRHAHVDVIREALARGDVPAARAHHLRAVRGELDSFSADMTLLVRHGEALLAAHTNAEDAEASFRAAHEAATASTRPFDRARLALDYGVWLRRQRDSSAARTQLRSSHDVFARLEAVPWRDRARAELRATGVRVPGRAPAAPVSGLLFLSAQEQRIARLAATGLSNREIADRLLISPRTVASHLYKVFPRLGVSSRRELAEVLGEFGSSA